MNGLLLLLALVAGQVEPTSFGPRKVFVYTPPGYDAKAAKPYDLVVLFDAEWYVGEIAAPAVLDDLIAANKIPPVVAVIIDNGQPPARITELANNRQYADYLAKELIPWVRSKWRVTADPRRVVIGGASAGGLGAAYAAYRHPEVFGNVLTQSGAFWRGNEGASLPGEWLTGELAKSPRLPIRFYVDVGALETHAAANGVIFIEANRHLRDALRAKGYDAIYIEAPGSKHEPGHWKAQLGPGLTWLLQ